MSRNTDSSAPRTTGPSLARLCARPDMAAPAQLLLELARPWRVIASQVLTMAEPLCTPEQRGVLKRRSALLTDDTGPSANGSVSPATPDAPVSRVGDLPEVNLQ